MRGLGSGTITGGKGTAASGALSFAGKGGLRAVW